MIRTTAENMRILHRLGCRGCYFQGNYVSYASDLALLKNYVFRKVLWDPTLQTDRLIAEFCRGYYGPTADQITQYVCALEEACRGRGAGKGTVLPEGTGSESQP